MYILSIQAGIMYKIHNLAFCPKESILCQTQPDLEYNYGSSHEFSSVVLKLHIDSSNGRLSNLGQTSCWGN